MNRFVTFCIGVGIALLVLAVISNTSYAATTIETADGNPTMTNGTISAGSYTNTQSDDDQTQDLLEAKVGNKYYLDCYYNLNTAIDASRISAFEIGVYACYTKPKGGQDDSYPVDVWDDGTSSWDSTTIIVAATTETPYTDTGTMGSEHIRASDGNIAIRFDTNTGTNKANTLKIDYLYVKLTYTTISDVATGKSTYKNGEMITTSWTSAGGFGSGESYINVEYWDVTAGTRFDLTSHATSASSSTSKELTSSEVGHKIDVYVYTSSSSTGDRSTAVTQGGPWPYSIPNVIQSESWNSYNDPAHENPDETFSDDEHTVYMHGTGFALGHEYKVAYYDANNAKVATETISTSTDTGALSSQYYFPTNPSAIAGEGWHSAVYDKTDIVPSTYNPDDSNMINADSFNVESSAIPEFPTVITGFAVCMLCAVAYVVMRRRAEKG